jgi:hypothetical protein
MSACAHSALYLQSLRPTQLALIPPKRHGAFAGMVLLGIAFWAIGARTVRRGLLAPATAAEAEPR